VLVPCARAIVQGVAAASPSARRCSRKIRRSITVSIMIRGFRADPLARNSLILQTRRDGRVVEGARLESKTGEPH
jgi:hypothetical protein